MYLHCRAISFFKECVHFCKMSWCLLCYPIKKTQKKKQKKKRRWQESRRGGVNLEKFDNTYIYYSGKHHKILVNYRR